MGTTIDATDRGRIFRSLLVLMFFVGLARMVFPPLVGTLMGSFDVREGAIGLTITLMWLGAAASALPAGYLLARVRRHEMIIGTCLVVGGASFLTASAPSIPVFTAGALLLGLGVGGYFIASNPLLTELYPSRVGRVVGIHGTAHQVAATVAPLVVAGVVYVTTWRVTFVLIGVLALVATGWLYLVVRDGAAGTDARPVDAAFLSTVVRQWRVIGAGIAMTGGVLFVWMGMYSFYVPYLVTTKALPSSTANTMLSAMFAAGIVGFWLGGTVSDRYPRVPLLLGIGLVFASLSALLTFARGLAGTAALSVALGVTIHALFPAVDSYILDAVPNEHRSGSYAVLLGVTIVVQAPGSVVVGTLVQWGYAYDLVFRAFAVALVGVFLVTSGAYRAGLLPE